LNLVEADIVEAFKTSTTDGSNAMIWDQEMLFPSHKYVLPLGDLRNVEVPLSCLFLKGPEGRKLGPVL
jgi:hypothetical protein